MMLYLFRCRPLDCSRYVLRRSPRLKPCKRLGVSAPLQGGLQGLSCACGQGELLPHCWSFLGNAGLWGSASSCLFGSLLEQALNLEIKILLKDKIASLKQTPTCQALAFSVQVLNLLQLRNFWHCLHPVACLLPTCKSSAGASYLPPVFCVLEGLLHCLQSWTLHRNRQV